MQIKSYMPTKIIQQKDAVSQFNFVDYGKKALLVTGKSSAKQSGALDDCVNALCTQGIGYLLFDEIEQNPTLDSVYKGGQFAKENKVEFIIGIGGGSPLDASKAIAVFATNDIEPSDIFKGNFSAFPLPILAIPTTAGTGSEVTPYSILTLPEIENKQSFASPTIFPQVALLDAKYTETLPYTFTVSTALDAYSHSVEGYFSMRADMLSDTLALAAIRGMTPLLQKMTDNQPLSFEDREQLLYYSTVGGIVIAQTGTTIVHAMGYSLTYFKNCPHGLANTLLLGEAVKLYCEHAPGKKDAFLAALSLSTIDDFQKLLKKLAPQSFVISPEEIAYYSEKTSHAKSIGHTYGNCNQSVIEKLYQSSLKY